MNRDLARELLESGNILYGIAWNFWKTGWECDNGCCHDEALGTEDVLDVIELFGGYEDITVGEL